MTTVLAATRPAVSADGVLSAEVTTAVTNLTNAPRILNGPAPGLDSLLPVGDAEFLPEERLRYAGEFLKSHPLLLPYARRSLTLPGLLQVEKPQDFVTLKNTITAAEPAWYALSIPTVVDVLFVTGGSIMGLGALFDGSAANVLAGIVLGGLSGFLGATVCKVSSNIRTATRCARALTDLSVAEAALEKAPAEPDFVNGFFAEHPEELKPFLTEFFPRKLTEKKGIVENEIRALEVEIAQITADRDNEKLAAAPAGFRAGVIADQVTALAALRLARDKLNDTLTALSALLIRVPQAAIKIETWLMKSRDTAEIIAIAERAVRGENRAERARQVHLEIKGELDELIAETSGIVTEAVAIHRAHAATELEMAQLAGKGVKS